MNPRILLAPAAAGKTEYCLAQIEAARADEPLAPIWVILPDATQVGAFRRRLARRPGGGAFNVHLVTFARLYGEALALAGEALPRLDEPVLHRLLRAIVDELVADGRLPYYAPLQDKPGFFQALRSVIGELKQAAVEPEALATAVSPYPPRLQELALIYDRYQKQLQEERWADDEGRGWLAALALAEQPDLCAGWRLLLVDGFDEFNPTQLAVLGHLAKQAQETIATLTGDAGDRAAHRRFRRARTALEETWETTAEPLPAATVHLPPPLAHLEQTLFQAGGALPDPAPPGQALTLLETPDRAGEVRAALRWLKRRHVQDGVPLEEMAVLSRNLETYRPFLEETAAEFGLPLKLAGGGWLEQNPAIAALLDLLTLPVRDWPRRLLLEAWRSPYFDWSQQGIMGDDADLLAAAAREAQVIAGLAQWREALRRLAGAEPAEAEARDEEAMDETAVLTAPRGPQAAALLQKFNAFVKRVTPKSNASLLDYVRWLEELIGDDPDLTPPQRDWHLGQSLGVVKQARYDVAGDPLPTAERDVAALQRLKDVLRSLVFAWAKIEGKDRGDRDLNAERNKENSPLLRSSALNSTPSNNALVVSYATFWRELRGAAEAAHYQIPASSEQGTILAAPALGARGLSLRAVALLGLCEGEFPRRPPHEPLLRDPDRALLAEQDVVLAPHHPEDEATLFYEAVTRANERLLLTRPYLGDDGQPWEPSPYWEEVRRHSQADPTPIRAADPVPFSGVASPPELTAALANADDPTAVSYQRHLSQDPTLYAAWRRVEAGRTVLAARLAETAHGGYEGDLSHLAGVLGRRYGPQRPWSASRLESYAVCGFVFFAGYALGLEPRRPVEAGYDVRQLGSMYHAILEEVYRRAKETGETAADLLPAIARREFDAAPEQYGFRPTPLWERQREELTDILSRTVRALDAASEGWEALALEPPFGLGDEPPLLIGSEPGRELRLRGYIDRVDVDGNGRLRVVDYKSSHTPIAARDLDEGKRIQLALYALAARDALGLGEPAGGVYWHIGSAQPSRLRLQKAEGGIEGAMETAVAYALDYAEAIRQGNFAPEPPDGGCPDYCPAADFCWRYTPRGF